MTPTRLRFLAGVALVVGLLVWAVLRAVDATRGRLPDITWLTPATVGLLALALIATTVAVRPRLRRAPGTKPVPPLVAARLAALALACSRVGAALVGGYLGLVAALTADLDTDYGRERAVLAALTALAALVLVVTALVLERACRIPDDEEERGDGGLGSAA